MNRETARMQNLTTYNTGSKCIRGHNSDRYTSTGNCIECLKRYSAKFKSRHAIYKIVEVRAHPADVAALTAYVEALRIQREITMGEELQKALRYDSFGRLRESHST
jgi:hypothetical protein